MNSTICAISTALGIGAISIIRVSGPEAIQIVNSIFNGKDLNKVNTHTINYGFIVDKDDTVDEVLVSIMKAPKTFTKEDVVEINCHGGIAPTNKVLELLLTNGCALAEPGEFTKRAFLNGRIDLIEAEAIGDLIQSKTNNARKLALSQIEGRLSKIIKEVRRELLEIMANIEVNIDYPEYEDAPEVTGLLLSEKLKKIKIKLLQILNDAYNGKIIKEGIKVALIGKPNVGKSSILNYLMNEERAIVTNIAGTTRDIIEGKVILDGIVLDMFDTAGIRDTDDYIEQLGVNRSKKIIEMSDLVIYVFAKDMKIDEKDLNIIKTIPKNKLIILVNKNDLETDENFLSLKNYNLVFGNTFSLVGLDNLKLKIKEMFNFSKIELEDFTYVSNARQIALIKCAVEYIDSALKQLSLCDYIDMLAVDVKNCWDTLGEILGETYKEELLDELFSKFCLGK